MTRHMRLLLGGVLLSCFVLQSGPAHAQGPQPDWTRLEAETMEHCQAIHWDLVVKVAGAQ